MAFPGFLKKLVASPVLKALALVVVLCFIVAVIIDLIVLPIFAGRYASRGNIPEVTGLSADSAVKVLEQAGFVSEWVPESRYSSEIPEGFVLVQHPVAHREAKLGRTVFLTKSKGLREVTLPDLRGKSRKQASMSITRAGLIEGPPIPGAHVSIPRGVVIRTEPRAKSVLRIGDTVSVVYSAGEKTGKVLLPNCSGFTLDSAKQEIEKLGFVSGKVQKDTASNLVPGVVISQIPRAGEYLNPGTIIDWIIVH